MTATATAPAAGLDPIDGLPAWSFDEADPTIPGVLLWERLGTGVRCETWLAWSTALWTPVAVKLARPHQVDHPRAAAALRREVTALDGTLHPVLPRLYRDGTAAPIPHVVLEYVDGPALDDELDESGLLDPGSAVLLGTQLLSALLVLHSRGLAHLDVKPGNVVVRDGRPVLIDFGSTRPIGSDPVGPGAIGTTGYTAPELETGAPISAGMDVYGVGRLLQEATDGSDPALQAVLTALTGPNARRLGVRRALDALAACIPADDAPWPIWALAAASTER